MPETSITLSPSMPRHRAVRHNAGGVRASANDLLTDLLTFLAAFLVFKETHLAPAMREPRWKCAVQLVKVKSVWGGFLPKYTAARSLGIRRLRRIPQRSETAYRGRCVVQCFHSQRGSPIATHRSLHPTLSSMPNLDAPTCQPLGFLDSRLHPDHFEDLMIPFGRYRGLPSELSFKFAGISIADPEPSFR